MKKHFLLLPVMAMIMSCTSAPTTYPTNSPSSTPMPSSSMMPADLPAMSQDYTKPAPATQAEIQTASVPARDSAEKLADGSLYSRLGGIKAIRPVVHQIAVNAIGDSRISKYFTVLSEGRLTNLEQRVVEQLCMVSGGPCIYTGEDMPESHRNLKITSEEFDAFIEDAAKALDTFKVPAKEKGEVAGALIGLKEMIINK